MTDYENWDGGDAYGNVLGGVPASEPSMSTKPETYTREELEAIEVHQLSPGSFHSTGKWFDRVAIPKADYLRLRAVALAGLEDQPVTDEDVDHAVAAMRHEFGSQRMVTEEDAIRVALTADRNRRAARSGRRDAEKAK